MIQKSTSFWFGCFLTYILAPCRHYTKADHVDRQPNKHGVYCPCVSVHQKAPYIAILRPLICRIQDGVGVDARTTTTAFVPKGRI